MHHITSSAEAPLGPPPPSLEAGIMKIYDVFSSSERRKNIYIWRCGQTVDAVDGGSSWWRLLRPMIGGSWRIVQRSWLAQKEVRFPVNIPPIDRGVSANKKLYHLRGEVIPSSCTWRRQASLGQAIGRPHFKRSVLPTQSDLEDAFNDDCHPWF